MPKKHKIVAEGQPQLLHSILKPALQKSQDYKGAKEKFKEKTRGFKIKRLKPITKVFSKKHKVIAKNQEVCYQPQSIEQPLNQEKDSTSDNKIKKERFKKIKEKIRSFKIKKVTDLEKGKSRFKKLLKGKLNSPKVKKNKIIDSKRLAFLLTAGTIIAILPTFNLASFSALGVTSACIFSINFIAVKALKKFVKQRKLAEKSIEVPKKLEDVSIESVQKEKLKQKSID